MGITENKLNDEELKNVAGGDGTFSKEKCRHGLHAWQYLGKSTSDKERRIICPVCGTLGWRRYNLYLGYYNVWDE